MNKINVAIVEDHHDFRRSVADLINAEEHYTCIEYASGIKFMDYIKRSKLCPDIVLMDINMPDVDGIECTRQLKLHFPKALILICTVHEDDEKIFRALKAGASGYILKRAAIDELFAALEDLLSGGSPMSSVIARRVVVSFNEREQIYKNEYNLSVRENEILDLLARGLRLKEIADKLFITINTVRTHIRHIYEKLQVQSRVEALNKTRHNFFES